MNNRVQFPYGNAFLVQTPSLDHLSAVMYHEQMQRQQRQQAQNEALDAEFGKNMSGIRDADIPDYTQKYTDWKLARQELMKMRGVNSKDYIQKQLEVNKKLADIYGVSNLSKTRRLEEENLGKAIMTNPDNFDDNAHSYLSASLNTPVSGLRSYKTKDQNGNDSLVDLTDYNTYRYKGTNTDFQKINKDAQGMVKQTVADEKPVDGSNLQIKITPYQYGNTPAQFMESYLGALHVNKAGRDAAAMWDQIPQETKDAVDKAYKEIPAERWRQMGVSKPQELSANPNSKADQFAAYNAKLYALNNEPKQGSPIFRDNKSEELKRKEHFDLKKLAIQNEYARQRQTLNDALVKGRIDYKNSKDGKQQEGILNDFINTQYNEGKPLTVTVNGQKYEGRSVAVPKSVADHYIIDKGKTTEQVPSEWVLTKDLKHIVPVYKTGGHTGSGNPIVNPALTKPILIQDYKASLGKAWLTKTQTLSELEDEFPDTPPATHVAPAKQQAKKQTISW
jgi:hypothetical protein